MKHLLFFLFIGLFPHLVFSQTENDTIVLDEIIIPLKKSLTYFPFVFKQPYTDSTRVNQTHYATDFFRKYAAIHFKENGYGMVSSPAFRGTTAAQTSIVWNGIPVNSPFLGQTDFNTFHIGGYDHVTVLHGGASALLGSGAIGGAILLNQEIDYHQSNKNYLSYSVNSLNNHLISVDNQIIIDNFYFKNFISYGKGKNIFQWKNLNFENRNAEFETFTMSPVIGYRFSNQLSINYYGQINISDRNFALLTPYQTPTKYKLNTNRHLIKIIQSWNTLYWETDFAWLKEEYQYYPNKNIQIHDSGSANTFYFKSLVDFYVGKFWKNYFQIDLHNTNGKIFNDPIIKGNLFQYQLTWAHNFNLKQNWNTQFSLKWDANNRYKGMLIYSLATNYTMRNWQFTALANSNYRTPTFNDLFWKPGGNIHLIPESAHQQELGITYHHKMFEFNIRGYNNHITNMIRWLLTNEGYWQATNANTVKIMGIDFMANIKLKRHVHQWRLNNQLSYIDAKNASTKKQLMYVPKWKWTTNMDYTFKTWQLNINHIFTDNIFTTDDENSKYSLDKFYTIDIAIGKLWSDKIPLFFQIEAKNITNLCYYSMPNRPMPPRHFNFKIIYNF